MFESELIIEPDTAFNITLPIVSCIFPPNLRRVLFAAFFTVMPFWNVRVEAFRTCVLMTWFPAVVAVQSSTTGPLKT